MAAPLPWPAAISTFAIKACLTEVIFADNSALTTIGNWAFYNCHKLYNITIPEGVTKIGEAAFFNCTYLAELTLPSTLYSIADNSFAMNSKLTRMNINAIIPPTVEPHSFEDVDRNIPVVVPNESIELYKEAPIWREFNIVGKNNSSTALNNITTVHTSKTFFRDGQLLILRDGKTYNAMGQEL